MQICQTKQQIEEGLKGHDEKWTAMMEKNKEEIEKTKENMEKKVSFLFAFVSASIVGQYIFLAYLQHRPAP